MSLSQRFEYGAKIALFALAGLLPVWFIPSPRIGIDLGREITFGVLILLAAICWLVSILASGEIRYQRSPLAWAGVGLLAVFGAATIFSKAPLVSAWFADASAEKFFSLVGMLMLMVLAGSVFRRREDAGTFIFILIFSGAVSAVLALLQLTLNISLFKYLNIASGIDANAIGTINGLALFYAALLASVAGLVTSRPAGEWKPWVRGALMGSAAAFLCAIMLINFLTAWIVLLSALVFLFGLMVIQTRMTRRGNAPVSLGGPPAGEPRLGGRHWAVLALAVLAAVMIMVRAPLFSIVFPPEVSPSLSATISIAGSVFKENAHAAFFGSGPGTFGVDWARYKDSTLNQTIFWNVGFTQGNSWAATLLATAGLAGVFIFLLFALGGLMLFLHAILSSYDAEGMMRYLNDPLVMAAVLGNMSAVLVAFLYPANLSLALFLFLTSGLLTLLLARRSAAPDGTSPGIGEDADNFSADGADFGAEQNMINDAAEEMPAAVVPEAPGPRIFWTIEERTIRFETPWVVFLSSLAVILFLALGVAGLFMETGRMRAAMATGAGIAAANRGNMDEAIADLERAAGLEDNNFNTQQMLVAVRTEKIRGILQRAVAGENVAQEFQSVASAAVQNSQRALALYPASAAGARTQGALYEALIPFVPGAERLAFSSYQKAVELDPTNPAFYVDWGRSGLVFVDRIQLVINQSKDEKERATLNEARKSNLAQIALVFQKAADLKPDYAPAHFLLAQTQIRLGNIDSAIQSVENAKLAAPFDIGVAFQLGLLYYQKNDLDKALVEFQRAVSLNENYSNARYFLGLIEDKKGDKEKALEQFAKILALNPDNQEVKTIVDNLTVGKPALDGIVPPAAPPEKRKDAPVKEQSAAGAVRK